MKKVLWYNKPTTEYMEGLPMGNGRIATMALGAPERFRLALNHEWLWRGESRFRDYDAVPAGALEEVRELLLSDDFYNGTAKANEYFAKRWGVKGKSNRVDPYEPAGDVFVGIDAGEVKNYTRSLDLTNGLSVTEFDCDKGHVTQRTFVSAEDGVAVLRVTTDKPCALNVELSRIEDEWCTITYETDEKGLVMRGAFDEGIEFAVELRAASDGSIAAVDKGYRIENATDTLLLVQIGTSAKGDAPDAELVFPDCCCYDKLFERHCKKFAEFLGDAELDIPMPDSDKPTDERVADFRAGGDAQIPLLYFEYGRYLMASGSSAELPLNLQGKWNDELKPAWESDYHLDINLEMCYWFTETLGMHHASNTFFNLVERYMPHGMEMGMKLYGCRGPYMGINTDAWGRMTPEAICCATWVGAAPWLAQHFYDHWLYTRDEKFLRERCYPFIRDVARFFTDYIIERNGMLYIVPSQSPENSFVGGSPSGQVTQHYNSGMDLQLAHATLHEAVELAALLGVDADEAAQWADIDARLPWPGIDSQGRLFEFDSEREEAEPGHRHLSHLIGLHPMRLFDKDSEGWNACEKSLDSRLSHGGGHTGWSRSWVACMMARLGRPADAWQHFIALIADFATVSMLDLHPPRIFQIDGNMGGTAAVCEMLMHSRENDLYILPALPEQWPEGSVKGFRAMRDVCVDFAWENGGDLTALTLRCGPNAAGDVTLHAGDGERKVTLTPGATIEIAL